MSSCWKTVTSLSFAAIASLTFSAPVLADYPDKPVYIVVGAGPGGTLDTTSRLIAKALSDKWKQPVLVENKVGAANAIAATYVAGQKPDGYTLLMMNGQNTTPNDNIELKYDTLNDFEHIILISKNPNFLAINPKFNDVKTAKEFVELAKSKPGSLNYAGSGPRSGNYRISKSLNDAVGIDTQMITYQGGGASTNALLAGEVDFFFGTIPPLIAHVEAGNLRILGVASSQRSERLPDVPTIEEALEIEKFDHFDFQGLALPAGADPALVKKIQADVVDILKDPELRKSMGNLGFEIVGSSPEEFTAVLSKDIDDWKNFGKQ